MSMRICEICGNNIIDEGTLPVLIHVTGWSINYNDEEELQKTIEVCPDCLRNNPEEILKKLEEREGYE